jgi:hypothetical protein
VVVALPESGPAQDLALLESGARFWQLAVEHGLECLAAPGLFVGVRNGQRRD